MSDNIICDIDNVIADLAGVMASCINKRTGDVFIKEDFSEYDLRHYYKNTSFDEMFQFMIEDKTLETCPVIEGSIEGLNRLYDSGLGVNMVTSRSYHPNAEQLTADYLERHGARFTRLLISEDGDKISQYSKIGNNFLSIIDDYDENIIQAVKSNMFQSHILIDQPWNQHFKCKKTTRYDSLLSYADDLLAEPSYSVA